MYNNVMKTSGRERLLQTVERTVDRYEMLKGVRKIVIAFSSGPDSVCLLDALHALYSESIRMHLTYVNHGLRSQTVLKREENMTRYYAEKYGCTFDMRNVRIRKRKTGIEAAAREKRYKKLICSMEKYNAQRIALGHNLNDVVETFFMNLIRGSGARGLRSIPAERKPYIRPLINVEKKLILEYLRKRKLRFSVDKSNTKLGYRRNLIRHRILPELLKVNPELYGAIQREISILQVDDEYLEQQAGKVFKKFSRKTQNHVSLDIDSLMRYNAAVVNRVVMRVIRILCGNLDGFESKHFQAITSLSDKANGKQIALPKGLYARREYGTITIGKVRPAKHFNVAIETDGDELSCGGYVVRTKTVTNVKTRRCQKGREIFDFDELEPPLYVRNRKSGDCVVTKVGKKKMKKIYHEFKIPVHKRENLGLLCDQRGILWVLGATRAYRGFVTGKTRRIVVVDIERID
jgi:tRNA(Ile)-lysidine synthase